MPTSKSATKRMHQAERRRLANRAGRSRLTVWHKKFDATVAAKDKAKAVELFREYCSFLDKAAKTGLIKRNNADRHKSRAARKLGAMT